MKKATNDFRQYLINNHLAANTILPLPTFSDTRASRPHKSTCEDLALNRNALSTR